MLDDAAFLATIRDHPDEDGPRLVYADWLEEQGLVERAEFIRVQIQLAANSMEPAERIALEERERSLLARYGGEWLSPLMRRLEEERRNLPPPPLPVPLMQMMQQLFGAPAFRQLSESGGGLALPSSREWVASMLSVLNPIQFQPAIETQFQCRFRRGFVERIELLAGDFVRHADTLFELVPLREIAVLDGPFFSGLGDLMRSPALMRLDGLELRGMISVASVQDLLQSPHLTNLKRLNLNQATMTREDSVAIARASNMPSLRELRLSSLSLSDVGVAVLARNPAWSHLEWLDLSQTSLSDTGAEELAQSPHLTRLRRLDLHHNLLTGTGAVALAESPNLLSLTSLDLAHNRLANTVLRSLNRFVARLMGNRALPLWLQRFIESPFAARVESIILDRDSIDPADRLALQERFGTHLRWV